MKTKMIILVAALGLTFSACSGNKADEKNPALEHAICILANLIYLIERVDKI